MSKTNARHAETINEMVKVQTDSAIRRGKSNKFDHLRLSLQGTPPMPGFKQGSPLNYKLKSPPSRRICRISEDLDVNRKSHGSH